MKYKVIVRFLFMLTFTIATSVSANDFLKQMEAKKSVTLGETQKVQSFFNSNPQYLKEVGAVSKDIKFVTELLIEAVGSRNVQLPLVNYLLEQGADPNANPKIGFPPLPAAIYGIMNHETKMTGINAEQMIAAGIWPRMKADKSTRYQVIKLLMDSGADCSASNGVAKSTAVSIALSVDLNLAKYFLESGCEANPVILGDITLVEKYQKSAKLLESGYKFLLSQKNK